MNMYKFIIKTSVALTFLFCCAVFLIGCGGSGGSGDSGDSSSTILMGGAIQGKQLLLIGTTSTLAGSAGVIGTTDGIGSEARFNIPGEITTDGANLYLADAASNTIRKIEIATAIVSTLAGNAGITGSDDGVGSAAKFSGPQGITTDRTNIYVSDWGNHTIRKVEIASGKVTTLAGSPGISGATDGNTLAARFYYPGGITINGTNLYVADYGNHTIRKIDIVSGQVTTLAGNAGVSGSSDGINAIARFNHPAGITTDGNNLYVSDLFNNTIRKVMISNGLVTTLAGSAGTSGSVDGTGSSALFYEPCGITTDGINLYTTSGDQIVRSIEIATGKVITLAGSPNFYGSTEGTDGANSTARFNNPYGITTDGVKLYVTDEFNSTIRSIR